MKNEYEYFQTDYIDEYDIVGLNNNVGILEVKNKLNDLVIQRELSKEERFIWKLVNDDFYYSLYKKEKSIDLMYKSGFFLDSYDTTPELDIEILTTPLDKLIDNLIKCDQSKPKVVLVSTGGFSPVHIGHLQMMDNAKEHLELDGYEVLGGYFSPSHDDYVSSKYNGEASINIEKRVNYLEELVIENSWISVDKWESYYRKYSVNFTDVINRLEIYLNKHLITYLNKETIKVCYVYGSDNINFSRIFNNKGLGVCVSRGEFSESQLLLKEELKDHNVYFINGMDKNISSSMVRKGNLEFLPANIKNLVSTTNPKKGTYEIRDDFLKSLNNINDLKDEGYKGNIRNRIVDLLTVNISKENEVRLLNLEDQIDKFNKEINYNVKTISLDLYIEGTYNVDVSRVFEVSSGQKKAKGLIGRIGTDKLEDQLSLIQEGSYFIVDDDKATGYTENVIKENLNSNVTIKGFIGLNDLVREKEYESFDVVDMRDFIFGSKEGGLVIKLPNGKLSRCIYALPYVDVVSRASVKEGNSRKFSLDLWKINLDLFKDSKIKIEQLDKSVFELVKYSGFELEDEVEDYIKYHVDYLEKNWIDLH
jgi:nicotinic acid mononucleotide adenylyltransferase